MEESPHERRQREAAQRVFASMMPDLQRVMKDIAAPRNEALHLIGERFTNQHAEMFKKLAQASAPRIPAIKPPVLALDYKSLFPNLTGLGSIQNQLQPAIRAIQEIQRQQFADLFAKLRVAIQQSLPPNWRGDDVSLPTNLESLLLDEGLPLAWLPPKPVLIKVFAATTAAERRRIIGRSWKQILTAAEVELDALAEPRLIMYQDFAKEAAETLRCGHLRASQALSANLLDSILRAEFDPDDHRSITGQRHRFQIDDYPIRVAIVLGGVWGAHGQYWPSNGDPIPRNFSRHASAHGVSRKQYSRINAVLALMHVVSLLKVLERDLSAAID